MHGTYRIARLSLRLRDAYSYSLMRNVKEAAARRPEVCRELSPGSQRWQRVRRSKALETQRCCN